jgi:phosphinothricin acetyltransferase
MTDSDWPEVRQVYEEGLATGVGSFETEAPSWDQWNATRLPHSRLVAREDGHGLVGWAALSPFSKRSCYAGVAEVGIYVATRARGRGVGRALLQALIESAEAHGIWTLQVRQLPTMRRASLYRHLVGFVWSAGAPGSRNATASGTIRS